MIEKTILEAAAKLFWIDDFEYVDADLGMVCREGYWNPLTDDGDALRLASKLGINIKFAIDELWANGVQVSGFDDENRNYCLRQAIVYAAADIYDSRQFENNT